MDAVESMLDIEQLRLSVVDQNVFNAIAQVWPWRVAGRWCNRILCLCVCVADVDSPVDQQSRTGATEIQPETAIHL